MAKNTATPIPAHERHPSVTVDALTPSLTVAERDTLADCEATIQRGMQTFIEVGNALMTIRNNRLYRAEFGTFEDYCAQRWSISRSRAYQLMEASEVVYTIVDKIEIPPPANEAQARELAKVAEPERAEVWREAHETTGGAPTAAAVRKARESRETSPAGEAEHPASADTIPESPANQHPHVEDRPGEVLDVDPQDILPPEPGDPGDRELEPHTESPAVPTPAVDPVFSDDPKVVKQNERERLSHSFSRAVGSLWAVLDPDPVDFVTDTWLPSAAAPDYAVVPHVFKPEGLRTIADHLYSIAEHLEAAGGHL